MEASSKSLDMTIAAIGEKKFSRALEKFLALKKVAYEICPNKTIFPCSHEGVVQVEESRKHCYAKDFGCGYPCFDALELSASIRL